MKTFARLVPFVVAVGACLLPTGPSVAAEGERLIPGFAYSAPFEDLKIKK